MLLHNKRSRGDIDEQYAQGKPVLENVEHEPTVMQHDAEMAGYLSPSLTQAPFSGQRLLKRKHPASNKTPSAKRKQKMPFQPALTDKALRQPAQAPWQSR